MVILFKFLVECLSDVNFGFGVVNFSRTLFRLFVQQGMPVVPVIGILNVREAFKPAPNPAEVEALFDAPMEMFIKVSL